MKGRLLLANGYIISKVIYMLPLRGRAHKKYRQKVQIILNDTARWVTGNNRRTKKLKLLKLCKWLDLEEMTQLHSLTTMWKITRLRKPRQLSCKIKLDKYELHSDRQT